MLRNSLHDICDLNFTCIIHMKQAYQAGLINMSIKQLILPKTKLQGIFCPKYNNKNEHSISMSSSLFHYCISLHYLNAVVDTLLIEPTETRR